jgi:transcriptional regulator with XRE-family HTH domain
MRSGRSLKSTELGGDGDTGGLARRWRLGWQAALAERMGVDRAYVSGLEQGQRNPTIVTLWHISEALGVTLRSLRRSRAGVVTIEYDGFRISREVTDFRVFFGQSARETGEITRLKVRLRSARPSN